MNTETITINNVTYDKHTGMPIRAEQTKPTAHSSSDAHGMHQQMQKSQTLNRRYVTRNVAPQPAETAVAPAQAAPAQAAPAAEPTAIKVHVATAKSSVEPSMQPTQTISKFAKAPVAKPAPKPAGARPVLTDIAPTAHPMVQRVHAAKAANAPAPKTALKPSQVLKNEAIDDAMQKAPTAHHRNRAKAPKQPKKLSFFKQTMSLASAGTALLLIGGYFTYLNMPNLSVRVAAAQAGIDASYPGYRPSGYSLSGPVAYDNGQVQMKFASNGGPQNFTITQAESGWDSSAVLDNFVEPKSGDDYTTSQTSGLTVYTYSNNAAWVSNGILYSLKGDAPLSIDQVNRIATSM